MSKSILQIKGVTRLFANNEGTREINLRLKQGEIVALIGLNGAGKTTLMKLALGMLRPTSGTVEIMGQVLKPNASNNIWQQVGYFIEAPFAYPELTTTQSLDTVRLLRNIADKAAVARIIDELNLTKYAQQKVHTLSLGNRQRVGLAASLLHSPRLIVLDEPTNGLDPSGVISLRKLLRQRAEDGAAILVSSHHLDEVARIADRIVIMNRGAIIGELSPDGNDLERAFFERVHADDVRRGV